MTDTISLFQIAWDGDEVKNVVDSVTRGGHWANGPYVDEFEERIERYLGVENAVVFNSGTTALASALEALGVGNGDEVVVPSFTFAATANAARLAGADPVFADIESDTYGLDPAAVKAAITDDTAAIVPVHYAGRPCRIDSLQRIAADYDVALIEDAAEAFGATENGTLAGTVGDAGVFSFCQNKVVATGEGGAVTTDNDDVAWTLRLLRSHGRVPGEYFDDASSGEYVRLGNNYRMPDIVAGIGVAQMEKVEDLIARRRRVADRLSRGLSDIDGVTTPSDPDDGRHVYQLYTVTFDPWVDRNAVVDYLSELGVSSKVYFDPVHEYDYYQETGWRCEDSLTTTRDVSERVLSLPMYPDQDPSITDRIVTAVRDALDAQRSERSA